MPVRLRLPWGLIALAFSVPLLFAAFTGHAWEDYFITLRASRNLVEGHGLVFNPGQRVHTFTSPLGVLLPALCTWIAGPQREELALWLFRLLNAGLLAAAVAFVWQRLDALRVGLLGRVAFFGLLLADPKLIDFSINGMETAILLFFAMLLWSELETAEGPRPWRIALGCAGLMWTRPDACILGAALILPHVMLRDRANGVRRPVAWRPLITGILVGGALYVPWFAWAWWYYGSPIPHTIIAKSQVTPPIQWREFLLLPWRTLLGQSLLQDLFLPTYWFWGNWPSFLKWLAHLLSAIGAFAWLVPAFPAVVRRLSLAVFLGMFYICTIILFPWYSPPWMALCALAVALLFDHLANAAVAAGRRTVASFVRIAVALLITIQVGVFASAAWQMRTQQQVIEDNVRRSIGHWLRETASPGDSVLLEPLGYVGYYSQLKTYDMPGLSSPEVVAAVRGGARRFVNLIEQLHPTWLVLRPEEIADPGKPENAVFNDYTLVRTWNVRAQLNAVRFLPGRAWLERDAEFRVFRRKAGSEKLSTAGQ
jgi:hypothetical protein